MLSPETPIAKRTACNGAVRAYDRGMEEGPDFLPLTEDGIETALKYHARVRYREVVDEALDQAAEIPLRIDVEEEAEERIERLRAEYGSLVDAHAKDEGVKLAVLSGRVEYDTEVLKHSAVRRNGAARESAPRRKRFTLGSFLRRN